MAVNKSGTNLTKLLKQSTFLKTIAALNKNPVEAVFNRTIRPLNNREKTTLRRQGNRAGDWDKILVTEDFLTENIHNNFFRGNCLLGLIRDKTLEPEKGMILPVGIFGNFLSDVIIGDNALVAQNGLISNYIIMGHSVVLNNKELIAAPEVNFGNGTLLALGNETSIRDVPAFAEISVPAAIALCKNRAEPSLFKEDMKNAKRYIKKSSFNSGIIERRCVIRNNGAIKDSYFSGGCCVNNNTSIENTTLLCSPREPARVEHGNCVKNSIIQWGCEIYNMCSIENSVLTEYSHAEKHAKISYSLIGPNTGIAEGEVTASLVGPFVGFHHQSLLIAAFWPEGKGNIAHGANVGSNHTSKTADQEIYPGEGTFFGLGSSIKFPSNLREAPYSIIASGVTTLPQKLEFPFSLINSPARGQPGISPAYNEIFPAWVLSDNIYLIFRNEEKYKRRNKARRYVPDFEIFREEIVQRMTAARERLKSVAERKEIYLPGDIPGTGKNYLSENNRLKGIAAYNFYIHYTLLKAFFLATEKAHKDQDELYLTNPGSTFSDNGSWVGRMFKKEGFANKPVKNNLDELITILHSIAEEILISREKDDRRGRKIIDDYPLIHPAATDDPFVKEKRKQCDDWISRIKDLKLKIL